MFVAALLVFFASGFAALVYQVIWQRLLTIFSGADVQSATLVVAAFMTGLGCGSLVGGQVADRVSRPVSLMLFVAAELAVCGFGFASDAFFYGFLYQRVVPLGLGPVPTSGILSRASSGPPSSWVYRCRPRAGHDAADHQSGVDNRVVDAANTMGAAAGAFCASWWLLPRNGSRRKPRIAAVINIGCELRPCDDRFGFARGPGSAENGSNSQASVPNPSASLPAAFRLPRISLWCAVVFALSGFLRSRSKSSGSDSLAYC